MEGATWQRTGNDVWTTARDIVGALVPQELNYLDNQVNLDGTPSSRGDYS